MVWIDSMKASRGIGICAQLCAEAIVVGEIRISEAQKWATLAEIERHEGLIHSLYSCQDGGICKVKYQTPNSPSENESLEVSLGSLKSKTFLDVFSPLASIFLILY